MAAKGKQDYIALFKDSAFKVVLIVIVEIDSHPARLNEQHLFRELHLARHRVVHMRGNHIALRAIHVAELLREVVWGEEFDTINMVICA